jgi:large subunit ribosomal protein L3
MPGHMGDRKVTYNNLEVVDVRPEDNILLIKGQIPGARNSLVMVRKMK